MKIQLVFLGKSLHTISQNTVKDSTIAIFSNLRPQKAGLFLDTKLLPQKSLVSKYCVQDKKSGHGKALSVLIDFHLCNRAKYSK